jgi:hypothetical protein
MATTMTMDWTTYAILTPSKPAYNKKGDPVEWKVQTNAAGQWRCYCPSYIFSGRGGAVKTCKHIRYCQQELAKASGQPVLVPQPPVMPTTQHPQWASAVTITSAMVDQARVIITPAQMQQMVAVLAAKLAAFTPAPAQVPKRAPAATTHGVRYITFDD